MKSDAFPELPVLLVDDEPDLRHALAERLSLRGFDVAEANGGDRGEVIALGTPAALIERLEELARLITDLERMGDHAGCPADRNRLGCFSDGLREVWLAKLKEVVDGYAPDMIWFDSWLDEIPDQTKMEFLAYYFNKARELDKEVVVTFKQKDLPLDVGVEDFDLDFLRLLQRLQLRQILQTRRHCIP